MFKFKSFLLVVLVGLMALLAACSSDSASNKNQDPKELLMDAFNKSQEIESYAFDGSFIVSLDFDGLPLDQEEMAFLDVLKDLTINFKGAYQEDIEKIELILETQLNLGDLRTILEVPLLIEGEKIWVKIPAVPGFIPDEVAGQYIEFDLQQLGEFTGEEIPSLFDKEADENQAALALVQDIVEIFVNNIDDEFFTVTSDTNTIVTTDFSGDRFYEVIEGVVTNSLPEFINLLENAEYLDLLGLAPADLEELKAIEDEIPAEFYEALEEMKEALQVNKAELAVHIDKNGFISKQDLVFDATFTDSEEGNSVGISFTTTENYYNINEDQEFTVETPVDNVLDVMELFGIFMMGAMGFDEDFDFDMDFDMDFELDRVDELQFSLWEQEWFQNPEIEELFFTNEDFFDALYDEETLEMLLFDEEARKQWFSQFGIEL